MIANFLGYFYSKLLQIKNLLKTIMLIECNNVVELQGDIGVLIRNFYLELSLHPIKFTTAGFYTLDLPFLSAVSRQRYAFWQNNSLWLSLTDFYGSGVLWNHFAAIRYVIESLLFNSRAKFWQNYFSCFKLHGWIIFWDKLVSFVDYKIMSFFWACNLGWILKTKARKHVFK